MKNLEVGTRVTMKNILFLTDFSEPSEAALPFAVSIAREYGCKIFALHVLTPLMYTYTPPEMTGAAIAAQEESAERDMKRLAAQLSGMQYETIVERDVAIWPALEQALEEYAIDLVVLGTHGRTGAAKLLLGSVAEEIFRSSRVPVLTVGPWAHTSTHAAARFHRVLFATDFTPESLAAAPYAISLAQENEARLILLHVMSDHGKQPEVRPSKTSVANVMHELHEIVPKDAEIWCRPETVVEYGEPADRILQAATEREADLIVIGVRGAAGRMGAAIHLERALAHKIVAYATCPVLTVRAQ
jgi:nucleotide-binding universal stress UspA family protein